MRAPALPDNESQRVSALHALGLLDTPPEERFDRITRLAASLFRVPIAYISLVDSDRQWFKARCGVDRPETARPVSFCGHAILGDGAMVVPDTHEDDRFRDNPLVTGEPYIRFYVGQPLRTPDGFTVGTLCLADRVPRQLCESEMLALRDLAKIVEDEINLVDTLELQEALRLAKERLEDVNAQLASRNEFIKDALGKYMTDPVAEAIISSGEEIHLGGEQKRVTILMCDLRNFTPLAAELRPEHVVTVLNRFLGAMIDRVIKHGGIVDQILGDGIMATFGAPITDGMDAHRAVACAIEMQLAAPSINDANRKDGVPPLEYGIGINVGDVVVGNIGSEKRMKYSVIGAAVNLAERIESLTLGGQILISEAVRMELGDDIRVDGELRVKAKGVGECVSIYDVGGIHAGFNLFLPERTRTCASIAPASWGKTQRID